MTHNLTPHKLHDISPRRVQIIAKGGKIGGGYFKTGQFAYVIAVNDGGGMYWIDKDGYSKKGDVAYLISKTKDMKGGALWISAEGVRFTGRAK